LHLSELSLLLEIKALKVMSDFKFWCETMTLYRLASKSVIRGGILEGIEVPIS
jgi:hypothetical protein